MSKMQKPLRGIIPAPITPFNKDGTIRYDLFEAQIDYLLSAGADGLMPAGTTGEGAMLGSDERARLARIANARMGDRHLKCLAVLRPSTFEVLREIDDLAELELDYIAVVTPYYTTVSQAEIVRHFTCVADGCPSPVMLYNIPQNTHNPMALDTILELAQHPNIAGIKDSSGNFGTFQRGLLESVGTEFAWIMGEDLLDAPAFLMGGECVVTGLGNVWLEPYVAMRDAAGRDDSRGIAEEQKRINALLQIIVQSGGRGLPAIKAGAALLGRSTAHTRVPALDLCEAERGSVRRVLASLALADEAADGVLD
jgi:4-hydroxy-tetrahydrodipicolinate synthase